MGAVADLLARAAELPPRPLAGVPAPPATGVVVLACMDARLDVVAVLGLRPGDAHVLRNAGPVVTEDVLRSLVVSQRRLGTRGVLVLGHSRCGMTTFSDAELARQLHEESGAAMPMPARAFADTEDNVRAAMAALRDAEALVQPTEVRGAVFDVDTGRVVEVAAD